jgi:hypothetical protein
VGRAATDLPQPPLSLVLVGQSEPVGEDRPQLRRPPVGGASRTSLQQVADVEQLEPAALEVGVRDVDQPRRHQRLEHGRVAQATGGLLDVGHRRVRELPAALGSQPQGALSFLEVSAYCVCTHLGFREVLSIDDRPNLVAFMRRFGERGSAKATSYFVDRR